MSKKAISMKKVKRKNKFNKRINKLIRCFVNIKCDFNRIYKSYIHRKRERDNMLYNSN